MPLTITLSPLEEAAVTRQADLDGIPLEHWMRNHVLAGVSLHVREQAMAAPSADQTLAAMDAAADLSDTAMDDPAAGVHDASGHFFGLPPVLNEATPSITPPEPAPAPPAQPAYAQAGHARQANNNNRSVGPDLPGGANPNVKAHPCRFLLPEYPGNLNANDCQGTCGSEQRKGTACTWPPNACRNCYAFGPKMGAAPAPHALPRQQQ